jgi:hypothetical protein
LDHCQDDVPSLILNILTRLKSRE